MNKVENTLVLNWKNQQTDTSNQTKQNKEEKRTSIYAGNLNMQQDKAALKRVQVQKKAMKAILDTFRTQQQQDNNLKVQEENIEKLKAESNTAKTEIEKIDNLEKELQESYNVDPNSQEQKDLELLKKQQSNDPKNPLTKEEAESLKSIGELTDYQKSVLEYEDIKQTWEKRAEEADNTIEVQNKAIEETKVGMLKVAPMVKASEESDKILESGSKEIIGTLINESKEHIDEEMEKNKDKIEEEKEKKKAEEKKEEDIDIQKEITQLEDTQKDQTELEQELKEIMKQIPQEDILGIEIDQRI